MSSHSRDPRWPSGWSRWAAAGPETAGRAALAVVLAGGLVAGGLTTMAVVAGQTLDSAPRPQGT